jgi:O-acetyl-ADP-ribose deacetylase (regulator of RNase III)
MAENEVVREVRVGQKAILRLVHGDITEERVDAIVNAANPNLQHGGGVAGAIVRKGGWEIQEESNKIGYVPVGHAAMTGAGKLHAKAVIHAVGPRWGEGDEDEKLRSAVLSALRMASDSGMRSISLPAISSGIFGFPKDRCASIIVRTVMEFLESGSPLEEVRITIIDRETLRFFEEEFDKLESH